MKKEIKFLTEKEVETLIESYYFFTPKNWAGDRQSYYDFLISFAGTVQGQVNYKTNIAPEGCTRSHPHENMNSECKAKTEEIKATVDIKYDLPVAQTESTLRAKLIELGWTPPPDKTNEQLQKRIKVITDALEGLIYFIEKNKLPVNTVAFQIAKEAVMKEK